MCLWLRARSSPPPPPSAHIYFHSYSRYRSQLQDSNDNWQLSCLSRVLGAASGQPLAEALGPAAASGEAEVPEAALPAAWLGLAQEWRVERAASGAGTFGYGSDLVEVRCVSSRSVVYGGLAAVV